MCRKFFKIFIVLVFLSLGLRSAKAQESRIEPLSSQPKILDRTWFGLGIYNEYPVLRTKKRYSQSKPGLLLSFDQVVYRNWSGGLWIHWSQWLPNENTSDTVDSAMSARKSISPATIISNVTYRIPLSLYAPKTAEYIRPILWGGLGWLQFLEDRKLWPKRSKDESSEPIFVFGFGSDFVLNQNIGIRLLVDRWRGVKTYDFVAHRVTLAVIFGDLGSAVTSW